VDRFRRTMNFRMVSENENAPTREHRRKSGQRSRR